MSHFVQFLRHVHLQLTFHAAELTAMYMCVTHAPPRTPPPTLQPSSCFYPTRYLGLQKEMVLDTLVCRYLSFCFSFSTPSYPGGLRRMSRSLTNAFNSFRLSIQ